jgi:hypothetical protein
MKAEGAAGVVAPSTYVQRLWFSVRGGSERKFILSQLLT